MQQRAVVWLSAALRACCSEEGDHKYPKETGGVFMGYWHDPCCAVVTAIIGPGPAAVHETRHFEPDYEWQLSEIAAHYQRYGRRETYLGDWHTHPGADTGNLSRADRRVVRRIIDTPAARAATPLMAVFYGAKDAWNLTVWRGQLCRRMLLWPKLQIEGLNLRIF